MTDKIASFSRPNCKLIGDEIEKALADLGERLGLKFTQSGGSIGATDFTAKIRITINDPANAEKVEREAWDRYCFSFGLRPEDYGTEVSSGGHVYRVTGFALNRSARPIRITRLSDGSERIADMKWVPLIRMATDQRLAA